MRFIGSLWSSMPAPWSPDCASKYLSRFLACLLSLISSLDRVVLFSLSCSLFFHMHVNHNYSISSPHFIYLSNTPSLSISCDVDVSSFNMNICPSIFHAPLSFNCHASAHRLLSTSSSLCWMEILTKLQWLRVSTRPSLGLSRFFNSPLPVLPNLSLPDSNSLPVL